MNCSSYLKEVERVRLKAFICLIEGEDHSIYTQTLGYLPVQASQSIGLNTGGFQKYDHSKASASLSTHCLIIGSNRCQESTSCAHDR